MTGTSPAPAAKRRWSWWSVLLVASLALNMLIGGAVAARYLFPERVDRMSGLNFAQLLPRRFFGDLSRERRRELVDILKTHRDGIRGGREAMRAATLKIADALEAEPYDAMAAEAAIKGFSDTGSGIVADGAKAALDVLARLTPEERKLLAQRLRERGGPRRRK
jgi:uncharacterized membrane protein